MLNKLRSPSFSSKANKVKAQMNNFHQVLVQGDDCPQGYQQFSNNTNGSEYQFLQGQQKKIPNAMQNMQKQKVSKSSEKYQIKLVNQGPPLKDRNDSQGKNARHESLQSKIKNKRRYQQGLNVNLKENVYTPKSNQVQQNQFNNTTTAVIPHFTAGLSERQIDLSQTQNLEPSSIINNNTSNIQQSNHNLTIKSAERSNHNFDFGCQLKMPSSTKNATQKHQVQQKGNCGNANYSSFFPNAHLQEFITNMTTKQSHNQQTNNTTTNIASAGNLDKSQGKQRKPSNQSSKKSIVVPILDMKKLSLKQVQTMMKQKATSIRESKNEQQQQQQQQNNTRRQTEAQAMNQLQNIGDSALYKNLTQKLIKEQQLQQQLKSSIVQNQKYSTNNNGGSTTSSKFNLLKKQGTPYKNPSDATNISSSIQPAQSQERYYTSNITQSQIPSASTTNKNQKSFNFDLMPSSNSSNLHNNMSSNYNSAKVNPQQQSKAHSKKLLNLTGTLPKGLLSPTNNSSTKHKHAQYFEMANTVAFNQFENTQPINLRNPSIPQQSNNPAAIGNNTLQCQNFIYSDIRDYNVINTFIGCNHAQNNNQQCYHYQQQPSQPEVVQGPHKKMQNLNQSANINIRQKLNQTTKIERSNSNNSGEQYQQMKKEQHSYKSQVFNQDHMQKHSKGYHQKTATLPNAGQILLRNIVNSEEDNGFEDFKSEKNIKSVGQTPRVERHNRKNSTLLPFQKTLEIPLTKDIPQDKKQLLHLQIELDDDSDAISKEKTPNNYQQSNNNYDCYDFNEVEVGIDFLSSNPNNNNTKLKTQKLESTHKPLMLNNAQIAKEPSVGRKEKPQQKPQTKQVQSQNNIQAIQVQFSPKSANIPQKLNKRNPSANSGQGSSRSINMDDVHFPINPPKALKFFMNNLTDFEKGEILDYKQIYFLGLNAKKIKGSPLAPYNFGFDDERGDYKVVMKDHVAYRFEVIEFLGKGSFGQALKCFDHKTRELVAVKLIRNKKRFQHQAGVELKILQHLKNHDPDDSYNIIRIKDYVYFRKHLVISFELCSINLYEFIKNNNFQGVSLSLIRRFAIQMLQSLKFLKDEKVIHCDLKPENILLKSPDKSGIKVIDFGSSCFQNERIYTYIQSRFYRAPEIILGIPYTAAIDMWSLGCILAELFTGYPLFPGENEQEQLGLMMEIRDVPPDHILEQSTRRKLFFDEESNDPILIPNSRGKLRLPGSKDLCNTLRSQSQTFLDFIERCLDWDPRTRMTPYDALLHDWIVEGLPPKVLLHHRRMLGINDAPSSNSNHSSNSNPQKHNIRQQQKSQPPKSTKNGQLNKTCLLSEAMNKFDKITQKRGKSLNKTGMIIINESEDMVDGISDNPIVFFNRKKDSMSHNDGGEDNIKSKTTNIADLLKEIKHQRKNQDKTGPKAMFENTYDISKLKKNSFFSQSKNFVFNNFIVDNIDEALIDQDCDYEDEQDGTMTPYDERDQALHEQNNGNKQQKNKIPFSFLMHHYLKTNAGQQAAVAQDTNVGFYKPQAKDVKLNNFIGAINNKPNSNNPKKGFVNLSSNV